MTDFLTFLKPKVGVMLPSEMDGFLTSQGCLVVKFDTYLSNPSQIILKQNNPEDFKDFIIKYKQGYNPVFVFKRAVGNNRFEYSILNNFVGIQTIV
jgi:hypothetical protein